MRNILITGANRGIGLALTRVALETGDRVYAACRHPEQASELQELQAADAGRLTLTRIDLRDSASHRTAREGLEASGEYLDILINNAGIYTRSPEVAPEASHYSIQDLIPETMLRMLEVNVVGTLAVTKELLPRIRRNHGGVIAFLSSGMGSIARKNGSELEYGYSASKAALNMVARVLAFELRDEGIAVVALNPGWVATDMGTRRAPLEPPDVAAALMRVVAAVRMEDTGSFIDYNGDRVPW